MMTMIHDTRCLINVEYYHDNEVDNEPSVLDDVRDRTVPQSAHQSPYAHSASERRRLVSDRAQTQPHGIRINGGGG
jgi:hypothetical protein